MGTVTTREPEFTADDVAVLLAHEAYMADIGPHGQPMSEATSPLANPSDPDHKWFYEGRGPVFDYAEQAIERRREAYKKKHLEKGAPMPVGALFRADKVDV